MRAPHDVAWMTGPSKSHDERRGNIRLETVTIDVYVFIRIAETTNRTDRPFRLGSSEMLGVFHSSSEEELELLSNGIMGSILSDVSWEPRESFWWDVRAHHGPSENGRNA